MSVWFLRLNQFYKFKSLILPPISLLVAEAIVEEVVKVVDDGALRCVDKPCFEMRRKLSEEVICERVLRWKHELLSCIAKHEIKGEFNSPYFT